MGSIQRLLTQATVASLLAAGAAAQEQSDDLLFPRLTIEAPLITRHVPQDEGYHDHNWGAFVDLDVVKHFGLAGGYFINSFRRDTAFAGVTFTPFYIELPNAELDAFATIAADLNGGYKGNNKLDPLLGAVSIRLTGTHFDDTPLQFLNDVGVAVTVVPPITAINLAVTYTIPLR